MHARRYENLQYRFIYSFDGENGIALRVTASTDGSCPRATAFHTPTQAVVLVQHVVMPGFDQQKRELLLGCKYSVGEISVLRLTSRGA